MDPIAVVRDAIAGDSIVARKSQVDTIPIVRDVVAYDGVVA